MHPNHGLFVNDSHVSTGSDTDDASFVVEVTGERKFVEQVSLTLSSHLTERNE